MAKVNEIIYDVREAIRQTTDDTDISDRYILYLYNIMLIVSHISSLYNNHRIVRRGWASLRHRREG